MRRHPDAVIVLALVLAALALRAAAFAAFPHAGYPDAFYYASAAREMASGNGMTIPYLWAFVDVGSVVPAAPVLPMPAFAHWMPGASALAAAAMSILGSSDLAAALPFILLSSLLPAAAYAAARWGLGLDRRMSALAGLLGAAPGYATGFLAQPDNFAPFALCVTACLLLVARGLESGRVSRRTAAAAGLAAAAAMLFRNDGFLAAAAVGIVFLVVQAAFRRSPAGRPRFPLASALVFAAAFLSPVLVWLARQVAVFGTMSVSAQSGHILWIRNYTELFTVSGPLGPANLLADGVGPLLLTRVIAAGTFAAIVGVALMGGVLLAPLAYGARYLRDRPLAILWCVYAALFAAWEIGAAAVHLASGNLIHGAVALLPIGFALAAGGMAPMLRRWAPRLRPAVVAYILAVPALVMAAGSMAALPITWDGYRVEGEAAVSAVRDRASGPVVVAATDPGLLSALDPGITVVAIPTGPLDDVRRAAAAYGARYLVSDTRHTGLALALVTRGDDPAPAWLADPVVLKRDSLGRPVIVLYTLR
jgi:hypothetical protein